MCKAFSWCCCLAIGILLTGAVGEPLRKHNLYNTGLRPLPQVFLLFHLTPCGMIQTSRLTHPERFPVLWEIAVCVVRIASVIVLLLTGDFVIHFP